MISHTSKTTIMGDLKNPRVIYLKGLLFLLCGIMAAAIVMADSMKWQTAVLLTIAIWSFCRAYYFAFYVIEHYVDVNFRFAGLWDFAVYVVHRRKAQSNESAPQGISKKQ